MAALRSLTDDDLGAGYDRLEARAHVDYDGTTFYPEWDGPDAAGTVLLGYVDRVIESLSAVSPITAAGGRGLDSPRGGLRDETERSAA